MADLTARKRLSQRTLLQDVNWTEGKIAPQPNPTVAEITSQHSARLRKAFLANKGFGSDPTLATAINRARQCNDANPCCCGGCPSCEAYAQRVVVGGLEEAFALVKQGTMSLTALTLVPTDGQCPRDALLSDGPLGGMAANRRCRRRLLSILKRPDIEAALAGFDVTLNVDQRGLGEPFPAHWQIHYMLIVRTSDLDRLMPLLEKAFPATAMIPRPIVKRRLDGNLAAAAYLYKRLSDPCATIRRVTIPPSPKQAAGTSNTRLKRLGREDWHVLLCFLDRLGLEGRLIVLGSWERAPSQADRVDPIFPIPLALRARLRRKQGMSVRPNL